MIASSRERCCQNRSSLREAGGHDGPLSRHARISLRVAGQTADTPYMRSILQRGTEQLQYEIYTGSGETPYVLRLAAPDGRLVLDERFPEPYALHERAARVERFLVRQGWHGPLLGD